MKLIQPYGAMAHNNAWANHRMLTACAALSSTEFTAPRSGFFPSLCATLNHNLVVDRFYVDAMEGGTFGPAAWADPQSCMTVAKLQEAQAAVDHRLIDVVSSLGNDDLERMVDVNRGSYIQQEQLDRLLLHLFQHQVHHRGQARAMMSSTKVSPPHLDEFFSAYDAGYRADDLVALGWTEETGWVEAGQRQ